MAISKDLLGDGEQVVLHIRTHGKALLWPVLGLIVLTAGLGLGLAAAPSAWQPWATWVLWGLWLLLVGWVSAIPFLRWFTATYTVTDRRIITRKGIVTKSGHDLPLRRINNVNYERSVVDRVLGCGTLVLETAAGQPLVLPDVPQVERVHVTINNLLFAGEYDEHPRDARGE